VNRAERIYRIDALLKEKPRPLAQLQEALEASRATVVRDWGYMQDFMQAPITHDRATNGYRHAPDAPRF
jgi:predicted DNA-binding transcriptional regulator YafY